MAFAIPQQDIQDACDLTIVRRDSGKRYKVPNCLDILKLSPALRDEQKFCRY
jgi:hypothetical protein